MKRLIDPAALRRYSLCGHEVVLTSDIDSAPAIDPVHAAGGCYCHECENCTSSYCRIIGGSVPPGNFCGQGKVRAANQWISVEDRLPEKYKDVLLAVKAKHISRPIPAFGFLTDGNNWRINCTYTGIEAVTHWMPLPEVPNG